jgi:hypothetical protein
VRQIAAAPGPVRRARLERPREIWGRRSVAVGIVLVGAALIGGIVLLATGGDGDSGTVSSKRVTDLQDRLLKKTVVIPRDGISVRRPADWKDSKNHGVVTLFSPSRCVSVALSAAAEAKQGKSLLGDSLGALRQTYKNVKVAPGGGGEIGGIPTTSKTIQLTDEKGNRRTVLLSVGTGKRNAYATQVVLGNPSCQAELGVAQVILTSIEYTT